MAEYDVYIERLEAAKKLTSDGVEYWRARDLQKSLGYERWEKFSAVIERAMTACGSAGQAVSNHFHEAAKMVALGSGAQRETDDWFLSRYACYLIAMNADASKAEVGYAQTYFAVQTRRQEQHDQLTELEKRDELRGRVRDANKELNSVAKDAGVTKYAFFHDAGYKGLYGGFGRADLKTMKGISRNDDLLDCIGPAELAANYFRITQAEEKLKKDKVQGDRNAQDTHRLVGQKVRTTMKKISGMIPENLPAEPSLKRLKAKRSTKRLASGE